MNYWVRVYRQLRVLVTIIVSLSTLSGQAMANSVSVDYIRGEGDVEGIKLAYQFYETSLDDYIEDLRIYVETSVNFWEYGTPRQHDTNFILALSPVIQKTFCHCGNGRVFGEFGIGISVLDDTRFAGKDVSTHYQFEDRLGIGYQFDGEEQYRLVLRYFHYSNGGVKKPNPGLDFISFSFAMRW